MTAELPLHSGRRRDSRLRLSIPARLITLTETLKIYLSDISRSGAKLVVPPVLRQGQEVVLEWFGYEAFGTIVWSDTNRAGMTFEEPLAGNVLLSTRDQFDVRNFKTYEQQARDEATDWYLNYQNMRR